MKCNPQHKTPLCHSIKHYNKGCTYCRATAVDFIALLCYPRTYCKMMVWQTNLALFKTLLLFKRFCKSYCGSRLQSFRHVNLFLCPQQNFKPRNLTVFAWLIIQRVWHTDGVKGSVPFLVLFKKKKKIRHWTCCEIVPPSGKTKC